MGFRRSPVRIGIDVGGTFTDAVAVDAQSFELLGQAKVPTSHDHEDGVAHGILEALEKLQAEAGIGAQDVSFLAHGTTQATNALLEGDVATVGLAGVGTGFDAFATRRLASLGKMELAPGRKLPVRFASVRAPAEAASAVETLVRQGAGVVVAVEPFSVDDPEGELAVVSAARSRSVLATATHEITSLYGLTKRTRTAVLNAGIMPRMVSTADLVEASVRRAGITAPLMVVRGDGGVMSLPEMRHRPLLTALSGPAAGVAGALMGEKLSEGLFLETGGTSTDISVVRRGRVQVRHAQLGGHETYLPALDVRTVGIGGGSLVRFSGSEVTAVGPRSAHIAGLPYACFAPASALAGAKLVTVSPQPDDPADYVALDTVDGRRYALTLTCAANALGVVPAGAYARAETESARLALEPLASALGTSVADAARTVLGRAVKPVGEVVDELVREYRLDHPALVGGGGGAASVTPFLGKESGYEWRIAAHAEVISPLGAALALVRESVERIVPSPSDADVLAVRTEAETAVVGQGADPAGVEVEVTVDPQRNLIRAVATGATELRTKDRSSTVDDEGIRAAVARSIGVAQSEVRELASTEHHRVFAARGTRPGLFGWFTKPVEQVRVVDGEGVVRLHSKGTVVERVDAGSAQARVADLVDRYTRYGDGGSRAPAVWLLVGPKIADLSGVLDRDQLIALAGAELKTRANAEPVVVLLEDRK
ncbi:hydantoinase/oxoprolinase family protein [Amycolatopsis jiangsuensis]|uniref:N-methylhydantoinase A/oxoprolinase/acetone carboxylase beta subunit n=1 Tax=Amycolatopsis jiangsuensis TaxID=1181879 RepID=A0A840ILQ0_9PSEU|nr:glutamate mutase L [Amycolatopsis jiangsuensis]MBB4682863.1 N-methylhydantoinase A/oxoprolinase/acetone carboxylase beta subunit [Amycolatopsis jiangsuensis]